MDENEARDDALLDLEHKSNEELRGLLDELYAEEQRVSYRRRVLHGKIDILRCRARAPSQGGREAGDDVISGRDVDRLIEILANDLRGVSRFDVSAPDDDDSDEILTRLRLKRSWTRANQGGSVASSINDRLKQFFEDLTTDPVEERVVEYVIREVHNGRTPDGRHQRPVRAQSSQ